MTTTLDLGLTFEHSYAHALADGCVPCLPEPAPAPQLFAFNTDLAAELGLPPELDAGTVAASLSGAALPAGAWPVAQAYAGHQFGGLSPSLGDGRALLLGEVVDSHGRRRDLALKGSGRTPFSRRGDGKAALGPMLRELIIGEALHALAIPSSRALAVVTTGETVQRERALPGAVLTRVAASHLRIGTLQYFAIRGEHDTLRQVADYSIARHYPQLATAANPYLALLQAVAMAQARLIAQWMHAGFIHGVMNTDNMTLSGESLDYGPCAFMNAHDPDTVFSSIDSQGRYAYGNQPAIAQWNLARLAEALLPLIAPHDPASAVPAATEAVEAFAAQYHAAWLQQARHKLALTGEDAGDEALIADWHTLLATQQADHTLAWRHLAAALAGDSAPLLAQFADRDAVSPWLARWRARLQQDGVSQAAQQAALLAANPLYIARNHLVEEALAAASEHGDMAPTQALLAVLRAPYTERAGLERYALPPAPVQAAGYRTFCGT